MSTHSGRSVELMSSDHFGLEDLGIEDIDQSVGKTVEGLLGIELLAIEVAVDRPLQPPTQRLQTHPPSPCR